MRKIKVSIDSDTIDYIVAAGLRDLRSIVETDYDNRKNGVGIAVFDLDPEKDMVQLEELLKSIDRVIDYCSPPEGSDVFLENVDE